MKESRFMRKNFIIGIYKITNPKGRVYIGQSVNAMKRISSYKTLHCVDQPRLYNSLKKYGVENHKFEVICECEKEKLNELEIYYINLYDCFGTEHGLNLKQGGDSRIQHTQETKDKIGNAHRGKKKSAEHIAKMKQRKVSEEVKERLRQLHLGKKQSQETIEKKRKYALDNGVRPPIMRKADMSKEYLDMLSDKWSGKNNPNYGNKNTTPEHKEKLRQANLGKEKSESQIKHITELGKKPKSEETKKRMSDATKGRKKSPEAIRNSSEARRGLKRSEEQNKKQSERMKGKMSGEKHPRYGKKQSQEEIDKRVETMKRNVEEKIINGTFKKRVLSQEARKKISDSRKGKKLSEEQKRKLLESHLGKKQSQETKAKRIETRRRNREANPNMGYGLGRKQSPEHIASVAEAKKRVRQEKLTMVF